MFWKKAPHYIYDSDQEHFDDEYRLWTNEMNVSYDLEDKGMSHIRQVHHVFINRMYNSRKQCFYYCFWTLKEYFEGESIMWFDYGACWEAQTWSFTLNFYSEEIRS